MLLEFDKETPIYVQLKEGIEDAILKGVYGEDEQIPSTTEISATYHINPATALKGINMLVDAGIIYKKRGLGMFVNNGAKELILKSRRQAFFEKYILAITEEAKKLGVSAEDLISMIKGAMV
ncbi:GntR family transcriptional regulator [Christensenellaceae bacterium OttesenSCG-928-M15]|nr:GntR family transcriptional regulator [Christensenellaceae bacterium OttesenSCG-928-M15]